MKEIDSSLIEKLEAEFSTDFEKNAVSKLLKLITEKIWAVDKALTLQNIPELEKMPQELRKMIESAFDMMLLLINYRGIFILNAGKEDLRAFYRIVSEGESLINVFAVPTNGKSGKELKFTITETHLTMESKAAGTPKIFFIEKYILQLSENQSNALKDKLNEATFQFMGDMNDALKIIFKN